MTNKQTKQLREKMKKIASDIAESSYPAFKGGGFTYDKSCIDQLEALFKQERKAHTSRIVGIVEGMERKTIGIKGILGTNHRDGVLNEGYNQALDDVIKQLRRKVDK